MKAKELLGRVRSGYKELEILTETRQKIYDSLMPRGQRVKAVNVQTSVKQDPMGDAEGEIEQLDRMIAEQQREICRNQINAMWYVRQVGKRDGKPDRSERRSCLILYYMTNNGRMDWSDVADRMGYSLAGTMKIARKALAEMDGIMMRETKTGTKLHTDKV